MLLKSLNYWSAPGGLENALDPIAFLELAKKHHFPAVELAIGETGALNLSSDEAFCKKILAEADRTGVKVASVASGLYWSRSLGDSSQVSRKQALEDVQKMVQITRWLGCSTLLFIPGSVDIFFQPDRPAQSYAEVYANAEAGIQQALIAAAEAHVCLGIENVWNKFLLSPLEMASFIDGFGSPWIGAYVDVGNIAPYGYAEDWLRILGRRVVGVHFKDFRKSVGTADGFVDLLEGDVDWPEVMAALKEIRYDGPVVAEMIPGYKYFPEVRIANTSNAMDAILGGSK
ncbi:MAG TPA: sugar phosphate isomerase/epimerase family protein [Fimbriimonadaceae bacterium]|jgi:hexulose-6-phosphate isomerase